MQSLQNSMAMAAWPGARSARGNGALLAFTLLELLMVIAILGLLSSLLLPVLGRAKSAAKSARCKSNLRQLVVAMQLYLSDSGAFPTTLAGKVWPWQLAPYMDERGLYVFADHNPYALSNVACGFICPQWPAPEVGYGYNSRGYARMGLGGDGIGTDSLAGPVREFDVAAPADMIALGDNVSSDVHGNLTIVIGAIGRSPNEIHATPGSSAWTKRRRTHSGVVNVGFCDSHAEAKTFDRSSAAVYFPSP